MPTRTTSDIWRRLRRFNLFLGFAHLLSAVAMLAMSNDFALPIVGRWAEGPPGEVNDGVTVLFDLPLGPATAAFLLMSAAAHLLVASPWLFPRYRSHLESGINPYRWVEYAFSASWMIVLIALLPGLNDLPVLVALFGANAAMILFGWMMEKHNQLTDRVDWTAFWFGSIIGAIPWVAITIQIAGAGSDVPTFVYVIFFTLFVWFNSFAINMALQYRGVGRWADYLFGERVYGWLSLTAKSLLAWQIFANTLIG
jgi:hypothetical protein